MLYRSVRRAWLCRNMPRKPEPTDWVKMSAEEQTNWVLENPDCCGKLNKDMTTFSSMTSEERQEFVRRKRRLSQGLIGGGIGLFGGILASMTNAVGVGAAFGIAIGATSGLFGAAGANYEECKWYGAVHDLLDTTPV
mmetsp:Transcript_3825/g.12360  ORF Transcript_3825/g.12360 Transcript_3825/m.12360 type:complete len:137 (-) Transcript_3825:144-554(-)